MNESRREWWAGKIVLNTAVYLNFCNHAGIETSLAAAVIVRYVRLSDAMLVGSPLDRDGWVGDFVLN